MAAEESTAMSYEKIYDMGTGLIIAKVQLDKVREQDINARIMRKEMQDQLTANIKNRASLRACPCWWRKTAFWRLSPATTASRAPAPPA